MLEAGIDSLVLGCTHYPFLINTIRKIAGPEVKIIDPSLAVARQTKRVFEREGLGGCGERARLFYTSGDPQRLAEMVRQLIGERGEVRGVLWKTLRGERRLYPKSNLGYFNLFASVNHSPSGFVYLMDTHKPRRVPRMRDSKTMIVAILGGLMAIALGCAPAAEEGISGEEITPISPLLPTTPMEFPSEGTPIPKEIPPGLGAAVELARQDLAERLGMPINGIVIVSMEAVEWPDASLGCPEPGMMYAQVITPGYRIILEAGGKRYENHSDRGKRAILCAEEGKPAPPAFTPPSVEGLVELAKRDLAQRLGLSIAEIDVLKVMEMELPIQDLGWTS